MNPLCITRRASANNKPLSLDLGVFVQTTLNHCALSTRDSPDVYSNDQQVHHQGESDLLAQTL